MIDRVELTNYLDAALSCANYVDYAPNGLQVEGTSSIQRLCTAVTASEDVIHRAIALQADAILVHHGYFWRGESPVVTNMKRRRLALFLQHDINLLAYHLPLDCHPDWGNNVCLTRLLELQHVESHPVGSIKNLLWVGDVMAPASLDQFAKTIRSVLNREPMCIKGSEKPVHRVALCSGAAADYIENAAQLGADTFLSGEVSERTYYQARELGVHYVAAGHHATERYGIQALGQHLALQFQLEHHFIDSDNPV